MEPSQSKHRYWDLDAERLDLHWLDRCRPEDSIHKDRASRLSWKKDDLCLILSYPPFSSAIKKSHEGWILDVLAINQKLREAEAEAVYGKKEIDVSELSPRISLLLDHSFPDIEAYVPRDIIEGMRKTIWRGTLTTKVYSLAIDFAVRQILQDIEIPKFQRILISGSWDDIAGLLTSRLKNLQHKKGMFDLFIHVKASSCKSARDIEDDIARELGLSTSSRQEVDGLLKSKSFLILLDDVDLASSTNLNDVGTNWWNSKKFQKMVCTTGSMGRRADHTEADLEIRLEDHLFTWKLFCMEVGDVVHFSGIQHLAIRMVKECKGHLLVIVLMARALRDIDEVHTWECASLALTLQPTQLRDDDVLFNALAFVCGRLGSAMNCLEYLVKMGCGGELEEGDLIGRWIKYGLIKEMDEGKEMVRHLVDAFLFKRSWKGDSSFVKMHSKIHEVLLNMLGLKRESLFLWLGGKGLTKPPRDEAWEKANEVHLMNNKLSELPQSPYCPELRALFLQANHGLRVIPPIFFEGMPALQFLDLSNTTIRSLPPSLFKLVQLRIFLLRGCQLLMELPPEVGNLINLEVLDLEGTEIISLPVNIKMLTNLKCLRVSFYGYSDQTEQNNQSSDTMIPCNVLSELTQLEELGIHVNPDDKRWDANMKVVKEVGSFKHLETLKLYLPEVRLVNEFMGSGTSTRDLSLMNFRFIIGSHRKRFVSRLPQEIAVKFEQQKRCLKYVNGEGVPTEIKEILQHATALLLERHLTLTKLSEFGIENTMKLEFCVLGECSKIQTLVNGAENYRQGDDYGYVHKKIILGSLRYLRLHYMKNLGSIWKGPIWEGCLSRLESLELYACPQLETTFTLALLENLSLLKELVVENCPKINSLVTHEVPEEDMLLKTYLPELKKISLHYLPKLASISSGLHIAPHLEWMSFYNCPSIKALPNMEASSNNLKVIIGEVDWWKALKWRKPVLRRKLDSIFVPIKSDADLMTQLAEIGNQLLAPKQETNLSQQSGSDDSLKPLVVDALKPLAVEALKALAMEAGTTSVDKQRHEPYPLPLLSPSTKSSLKATVVEAGTTSEQTQLSEPTPQPLLSLSTEQDTVSKINITGPSTRLEDDRSVHERIKQSAEMLNRMKDIVCLIISYPPMSLVNEESYKRNQYKWVQDILKINDVVREMEAPSKKKEIDAFKLENRISTLMTRYMDEIEPLFPQVVIAKSFRGICVERHGQIMPTPKRIYDLAVDFAIREILQHIEYPKIRKIGISGSHGETVISELWGELQECCIFDHVIDVDVSRCSTIEEIRFSIEGELLPSTSGERKLDETLKGTNFFILLHEVGERVNLYDMGTNWWNSKKIQKIVYTTNSQHVDDVTAVGVEIRMENHLLSWELFCVNVGEVVHSSGIQRLAINVVEKCCGHLLAVVIMARALKDVTDVLIWEYASYTLGLQHRFQAKDRVLFNALAFMWGRSGSTNKYLQYCVDMENWGQMDKVHLIEEWITSGLVGTFDEGELIVGDLVNAFLLESFQYGDSNFVGMRSEIHEELLNFLRFESCSPFLRLGGWGLTEPPKDEAWEKASEMHLMNNKLSELPTSPHGSQLKVLFLQSNHHLRAIPPIFFEGLPVLQILDLSYTRIRSLPQSLFKLFELRIFFLRGCELLMELPPEVGKLRNLEVLNLEGTKIINLPIDVERLTKLKCLNVSFHGYRKNQSSTLIPRNVIQQLFQLQELRIDVNPDDEQWNATMEDIVKEVCSLKQLEALKIYLPQVAPLDHFMKNGTSSVYTSLVHFRFVVGSHHSRIISRLPNELAVKFELQARSLKYVNGEGIPSQIKEVLQHCTALFLDRHLTLTKLSEFGIGNMKKLEFCVLGECYKIETIVDGAENCKQREDDGDVYGENILGSLQFLRLHYMKNLVSIWKGPVWRGCLSSLKSLALHECPQLTTIFTLGLLENLNSLEELVAEWCPEINSIVTLEDPAEHRPFPLRTYLPNLRKISLHYVPKLVNISSGLRIAPKLEWMSFYNCPRLETLSDKEVCCNSIKVIIGEADWWSKLKRSSYFGLAQWHDVFVPIKSDADLATQLEEIENQLLAERQERKPSQQSGEAERQERKPSQQSGEAERQERKPSQQSGEAERQERKPSQQSGEAERQERKPSQQSGMADVTGGAGGEIYKDGKRVATFAISNILYLKDLNRNYKKLMQEAMKLKAMRIDLEIRRFKTKPCIRNWIARALIIERQVERLETKYNNEKKHRWKLSPLANLSKEMEVKCQEVCSHREEGDFMKETAVMELPEPVQRIPTLKLEENSSLHKDLHDVLRCLEDKEVRRIGIWGKVGTGKTTVLENLNNHEKVAEMFNMVIYVTVSKMWSEKRVQDAILRRLKLDVEGNADVNEAALIISEELKGKKCLILLDEVTDRIDLNRIMGIDENPDSKVVLVSRYDEFCKCDMKADELVNVKPLLPTEAWNMFQKIVGPSISNPLIEPLARGVVEECYGLPLLIDRVAITFKKKREDVVLWDDGLKRLKRWYSDKIDGMDEVLERLQICYDDLKDGEQKVCFLYGALYPEESEIYVDYLLECWKAEGFINHASDFRSARSRGHSVLNELIKVSLLERSDKRKCVKMNKVFREMALKISSERTDSKFIVKPPGELEDFSEKEEWEQAHRISLMNNQLNTLPETLDCRNLLTLLLQRNKYLTSIPESFFKSMCRLQVLDLHGTKIVVLPSSLSNLIYLKGLYLNSCSELKEIRSSVEALKHLEVLDIRKTKLKLLQIGSLVWLKCLRLSLCNFDVANYTEAQVSRFDLLEELTIDVGSLEEGWDKIVNPVTKALVKLKKLTSLRFCFPKVDCLGLFVEESPVWESSLTFHFAVGYHGSAFAHILESIDNPSYNILKLANGDGVNPIIMKVLMKTNALGLIDYKGVSSLSEFGIENMNMIFDCWIEGCCGIKTIIYGNGTSKAVLEWLKNLHITNVPELENIWQGPVHAGSLARLTTVTLSNCPKLMKIFSNGMIQQLIQLTHLRVEECHRIEEIIMESENTQLENQALPKLETLELIHLPQLTSIWAKDSLEWPSLLEVKISKCFMLKSLPFNKDNATKLRSIEGQQSWWGALVWEDDAIKQRLQPLCILN